MNANYLSFPLSISWHFLPIAEHYIHSAIKEGVGNMIIIQQYTLHYTHFLLIHSCVSLYKHHIASNSLANCHQCPALAMPDVLSASIFHCLGLVDRPSLEQTQEAWLLISTLCLCIKPAWLGCGFVILFSQTLQNNVWIWNTASHYNDPMGSPSVRTHILINKSEALCPSPCITLKQHTSF